VQEGLRQHSLKSSQQLKDVDALKNLIFMLPHSLTAFSPSMRLIRTVLLKNMGHNRLGAVVGKLLLKSI
jgi:hypothetical protein